MRAVLRPDVLVWPINVVVPIAESPGLVSALFASNQAAIDDKGKFTVYSGGEGIWSATPVDDFPRFVSVDLLAEAKTQAPTLAGLAGGSNSCATRTHRFSGGTAGIQRSWIDCIL